MIGRNQLSGQPQLSSFIVTQLHNNAANVIGHPSAPASVYGGVGVIGVAATNASFLNFTESTDFIHLSVFLNATPSDTIQTNATTGNQDALDYELPQIPAYIRITSMVFCIAIMALGVIGNIMVPIVIFKTKDMRNSTNIFLTNLSIADLLVLLVCTPTVLVEVNTKPETWVLGREMCKAVPFVELTVAHASVLTILAISFERYYAICEPLKAGYVCTKARALLICFMSWIVAAVFTSPIIFFTEYKIVEYIDGSSVAVCLTQASNAWTAGFFLMTISIFFILPLAILIVLYAIIARNLILRHDGIVKIRPNKPEFSYKARKQVVLMLGAVVLSFFFCLLPFRVLTLWIIIGSQESFMHIGIEAYYNILYFCRIMLYINSAINPILYNIMSSKFRKGFLRLCLWWQPFNSNLRVRPRTATFNTTTTSSSVLSRSFTKNSDGRSVGQTSLEDLKRKKDITLETNDQQDPDCELQLLSHVPHHPIHPSSNGDSFRRLAISNLTHSHHIHSSPGNISPDLPSSIETLNIP